MTGRIVLADGPLPDVHRAACEERGAAGFLSDFPNQTTAWSGDDRDLVRWGHLSPYQLRNRFAFMISRRQAEGLRARLAAGAMLAMAPVILIGIFAQRHIVKGLTVGAVKGGGRR